MIVWLRQLARSRGEEDMLVNGYNTACQLVACEWIGRFGREPEEIPRWPGVPNYFQPPALPQDLPYAWDDDPDHGFPHPDIDHWVFDDPNGARNGAEVCNPGPLQVPCPNEQIGTAYRQAVAAWERGRDAWANALPRQGEEPSCGAVPCCSPTALGT